MRFAALLDAAISVERSSIHFIHFQRSDGHSQMESEPELVLRMFNFQAINGMFYEFG